MKRILTALGTALLLLACSREASAPFRVTDLQVEYMATPLGIDVACPRFSWKMESDRYGQRQAAYRITVREAATGRQIYVSEPAPSDVSVGVLYRGEPLQPCTRYDWTVEVWNSDEACVSATSWFETGLMDSGWSDARWISSGQPHFSKYRSRYQIDFDLACTGDDPQPCFLFGRQDADNYVSLTLNRSSVALSHVTEGEEHKDWEAPLARIPSHLAVRVVAHDYAKGYKVWLVADNVPLNKESVEVRPYPAEVWKPFCRFNTLGFAQKNPGCEAVFSNLKVTEDVWDSILYQSDKSVKVVGGAVEYVSPAEESGAPMLRKRFEVKEGLSSARLYTTARGIYEYAVNGRRLADDWFNPGSTDYRYRILYNSYDITPFLRKGGNVVGAMLGAGWWSDFTGYATAWQIGRAHV